VSYNKCKTIEFEAKKKGQKAPFSYQCDLGIKD